MGFKIINLYNDKNDTFSRMGLLYVFKVGKYRVKLENFSEVGVVTIKRTLDSNVVEIGSARATKVLISPKPVLDLNHCRIRHPLVDIAREKNDAEICKIMPENREEVQTKTLWKLLGVVGKQSQGKA